MSKVLGINIGGTNCSVSLGEGDESGLVIIDKAEFSTSEHPLPEDTLGKLNALAYILKDGHKIDAVGISCGGPLNSKTGRILSPPNLPGWDDIAVCDFFKEKWDLPVFLQNDANAGAVAEWLYGAGRGAENFIFITFGTGLGAGLILNGKLYPGLSDMAGELGHWRMSPFGPVGYGKSGSFEGFCSGGGILQLTRERLLELRQLGLSHPLMDLDETLTTRDMFELADNGDALCLEIIDTVGEMFGRGLAILIDLLNPEIIVAGSIFTRRYDMLLPIVERVIESEALPISAKNCRILPSSLGEKIGDMAALATALYGIKYLNIN